MPGKRAAWGGVGAGAGGTVLVCFSRVPWAFPRDVFLTSLHRPDALTGAGGRRGPGQGPDVPGQPLRVQRVLAGAPPGEGGRGEDAGQRKGLCVRHGPTRILSSTGIYQ